MSDEFLFVLHNLQFTIFQCQHVSVPGLQGGNNSPHRPKSFSKWKVSRSLCCFFFFFFWKKYLLPTKAAFI